MALFKILKGDSSRISTSVTPFHDGYAYFTPDDGGFYIDSEDNGMQRRIRINGSGGSGGSGTSTTSIIINAILLADSWINKEQTVSINGIASTSNGIVGIAQNITSEQYEVARTAMMHIISQSTNTVTIRADGEVPSCDIPIVIIVLVDSESLYATLPSANWVNNKQTIVVSGLTNNTNGVVGIAANANAEQTEAANMANMKIESQSDDELTITVLGKVPTCDIPIAVILTD